jgi:hypothetical protein
MFEARRLSKGLFRSGLARLRRSSSTLPSFRDYVWHANKRVAKGRFRLLLRNPREAMTRLLTPEAAA